MARYRAKATNSLDTTDLTKWNEFFVDNFFAVKECDEQPSVSNVIKEWKINNKKKAGQPMVLNPRSNGVLCQIIANEPFSNISDYTHALNAK